MICHLVLYRDNKPRDNVASFNRMAASPARGGCDCQHQGGRELEWDGMGNICELLINVVRRDKSKVLRDLNQKVSERG
jgi:hypothetical protein